MFVELEIRRFQYDEKQFFFGPQNVYFNKKIKISIL